MNVPEDYWKNARNGCSHGDPDANTTCADCIVRAIGLAMRDARIEECRESLQIMELALAPNEETQCELCGVMPGQPSPACRAPHPPAATTEGPK